jgi:GR25 family glycosyltransferase involved in LPS biosynthesis
LTINEVFERVLTINLDRRSDRWAQASRRLGHLGIRSERFRAVDGTAADISAEYEAYKRRPLAALPQGVRPIGSSRDYYLDYDSQTARVAHTESTTGAKAIQSAGAWGYLKSWEAILEQALRDRPESLLVFDDDVILHRRTHQIFAAAVGALPADWLILQLGTLQYHWESDWVKWRSPFLYSTNGTAIGSHAVGLRFEIVPYLLDHVKRMELPFDTGALAAATHDFKERCFVAYPHIAIQHLADSDISTSEFQKTRTQTDIAETYRWNPADYAAERGFQLIDKTMGGEAQIAKILL